MKAGLLLVLATACGEPLVGPEFLGTPVLEVGGAIVLHDDPRSPADHGDVHLSLFWIGGPGQEQEQGAELDGGLAAYTMTLFDAPPREAARFGDLLSDRGRLGLALIALYADRDQDDRLDLSADLLLGASDRHLVVWSEIDVPEDSPAATVLGTVGSGYHVYQADRESECTFIGASACPGSGGLVEVAQDSPVPLALWSDPSRVLVPSPHLGENAVALWSSGRR